MLVITAIRVVHAEVMPIIINSLGPNIGLVVLNH